jgi:hypothetical protein
MVAAWSEIRAVRRVVKQLPVELLQQCRVRAAIFIRGSTLSWRSHWKRNINIIDPRESIFNNFSGDGSRVSFRKLLFFNQNKIMENIHYICQFKLIVFEVRLLYEPTHVTRV